MGIAGWTSKQTAAAQVEKWKREPDYGICIQTRLLRAIDIDVKDVAKAQAIVDWIEGHLLCRLPRRFRQGTGKCLLTIIVRGELGKRVIKVDGGIIELLANGQQFVAAGTHPDGTRYEWEKADDLMLSQEVLDELWASLAAKFGVESDVGDGEYRQRNKKTAHNSELIADEWTAALEARELVLGRGRDGEAYINCPWKVGHSMDSGISQTAYFPAGGRGYEVGHFKCLHAGCTARSDGEFIEALGLMDNEFEPLKDIIPKESSGAEVLPKPNYRRAKSGEPLAVIDNICLALDRPDQCGCRIAFDTFKFQTMIVGESEGTWRRISDDDYTRLQRRLERTEKFKPISFETLRRAVDNVAYNHKFDSAIDWINGLKWDGVERIRRFLPTYFFTEDNEYAHAIGNYLWTALAGRLLVPGIKADMVPILKSDEGFGKSTSIASIAPLQEMFTEINFDESDNDLSRRMRGKLIGEIPELRGLAYNKEREWINAFITRTVEEWTPKYSNNVVSFARRLVFVASTNNTELFSKYNMERRWLPIDVKPADRAAIERDRNQLWAEGRELFEMFGILYQDAERLAPEQRIKYRSQDSWDDIICSWLDTDSLDGKPSNREFFTTIDVLREALQLPTANLKGNEGKRISIILRHSGYEHFRIKRDKSVFWGWKKAR